MTGIGGDCFCLVAEPGQAGVGLQRLRPCGAEGLDEALLAQGHDAISQRPRRMRSRCRARSKPGARSSRRTGTSASIASLQPAIRYAENGFPLRRVSHPTGRVSSTSSATCRVPRGIICSNGQAPAEGDVIKLPALAATLKAIAKNGPRAFYEGPIAEDIVATLQRRGSVCARKTLPRIAARR